MKGKAKNAKVAGYMRTVLSQNLHAAIRKHPKYGPIRTITAKQNALSEATGLSLSSLQRWMNKETGPSLDNIEELADELGLSVYQLLLPGLDVEAPQKIDGADEAARKVILAWKRERHGEQEAEESA